MAMTGRRVSPFPDIMTVPEDDSMKNSTGRRLLSALLIIALAVSSLVFTASVTEAEDMPFRDVKTGAWYYDTVKYVYEKGIMNGTSDTTFDPNGKMTRAMFVTILGRLSGVEQTITEAFTDVDPKKGSWYAGYVGWASENGIVNGYPDNTFRPNASLTREQMAALINRYVKYTGITPLKSTDPLSFFTDGEKISSWAKSDVDYMRMTGIVTGKTGGAFDPLGNLTRAEAATVMTRLDGMIQTLTLGEAQLPDYTRNDGEYVLLGAWDIYYSGTGLRTGYSCTEVDTSGAYPVIREGGTDPMAFFTTRGDRTGGERRDSFIPAPNYNPFATDGYYEIDAVTDNISLDTYPVIRIGFISGTEKAVKFGVYTNDLSPYEATLETGEGPDGTMYGIADLTGSGAWGRGSSYILLTLSGSDPELIYLAAFRTKAEAEAFDLSVHKDDLASYDGEVVQVRTADEDQVAAALDEAMKKADDIINSASGYDESDVKGTCYYISSLHGNDSNSGKSEDKPWKTFRNLYKILGSGESAMVIPQIHEGDGVFLERGSVFNKYEGGEYDYLDIVPGAIYGAYGEGEKPLISNRFITDEPAGRWVPTEWDNVWKLDYDIKMQPGNISFIKEDGTELWGIFVFSEDYDDPYSGTTRPYGIVTNGEDVFTSGGVEFRSPGDLKNNLEYFGDKVSGGLWVYCDRGNPGEVFREINITREGNGVGYSGTANGSAFPTRFDNIAVKYTGGLGLSLGNASNVFVTDCVFEWIGGEYQNNGVRFGNAVQNWGCCDGIVVNDCYFKDIYDAAVTTQGNFGIMRNFYSSGCVLNRCDLSYEFFNGADPNDMYPESELVNLIISGNYVINNGYGFCDVRTDRRSAFLYTSYAPSAVIMENVYYENNVNIYSTEFAVSSDDIAMGKTRGTILRNNTYYMDPSVAYYMSGESDFSRARWDTVLWPFTSQYMTYMNSVGVETGSTFFAVTDPPRWE